MTRRRFNRLVLAMMLATLLAFSILIGLLIAGFDPSGDAATAAFYILLLTGGTTTVVTALGDRMVPRRDDPDSNRRP